MRGVATDQARGGKRTATVRRAAVAVVGVIVACLAFGLAAPQASAAPCSGGGCTGLNPTVGCDADAITLVYHDYMAENSASFRLEVRYSRACNAAWARLVIWSGSNVGFAMSAWNPGGASQGAVGHNGNTTWTAMIDGTPPDCAGTQFYVGTTWVRWYYVGCG